MTRPGPAWLADLQARFGNVLRTPLDRSTGTLTATPAAYDPRLVGETGPRLGVYNRQYWFRLLDVMNQAFPLTARLCGAWHFNEHAARFLREHPPRDADIERITVGFAQHFQPDEPLLREAVGLDDAFLRVLAAPSAAPFRPSAADAARLLEARLEPSPAVALVHESAPLLALRTRLLGDEGESRVPLPERWPEPRAWMLVRDDTGIMHLPLEALEARLLTLLAALPVGAALGRLESSVPEPVRQQLPAQAQRWLARGVQHGFWRGLAR